MKLSQIWRHPIKAHGREHLAQVALKPGRCLPFDRAWAVAHEAAQADGSKWVPCANFSRGAKVAQLMAISCDLDETTETVTLRHPDRPDLTFQPETEGEKLIEWVRPLMPENRAASDRIVRVPNRGMTDSDWPSVSILNLATHRAIETRMNRELDIARWRGNLWLDGAEAWSEAEWIGKDIQIGDATLHIREQITRCQATAANPATGQRDADTLGALGGFGHQEMGVYAEVMVAGTIKVGDKAQLL